MVMDNQEMVMEKSWKVMEKYVGTLFSRKRIMCYDVSGSTE